MNGPIFTDVPVLCGHRGSGRGVVGGHAENTWGSVQAAAEAGLRWVEVDARLTTDGALVASHDPLTGDEQGLLDIAALIADLPMDIGVNVEIKSAVEDALRPRSETTAAAVARLAASAPDRPLLLSSFDPAALLIAHEIAPRIPRGLVTWTRFPVRDGVPAAVHLGVQVLVANIGGFEDDDAERAVATAHEAGLQVAAWCPPRDERDRLAAMGVDCLIVDDAVAEPVLG